VQPRDLVDGEFEIGLDRGEVDLLGMSTRPGEAMVIVWHVHRMPDDGCSMVNPQNAIPGIESGEATWWPLAVREKPRPAAGVGEFAMCSQV
jgi:hypothetical protein